MRATSLSLLAAMAIAAGAAGCALPEVKPLVGGTTAGPSPYGPWYEQHWATNAVLLAAAEEPEAPAAEAAPAPEAQAAATEAAVSTTEEVQQTSLDTGAEAAAASREAAEASREAAEAAAALEGDDAAATALPPATRAPEVPAPSSGPVRY